MQGRFTAYIFYRLQRMVGLVHVEQKLSTPTYWRTSYFRLSQYRIETGESDWTRRKWPTLFFVDATEAAFYRPFHIFPNPLTLLWFTIPVRHIFIASFILKSPNLEVNFRRKLKKTSPFLRIILIIALSTLCNTNRIIYNFIYNMWYKEVIYSLLI